MHETSYITHCYLKITTGFSVVPQPAMVFLNSGPVVFNCSSDSSVVATSVTWLLNGVAISMDDQQMRGISIDTFMGKSLDSTLRIATILINNGVEISCMLHFGEITSVSAAARLDLQCKL